MKTQGQIDYGSDLDACAKIEITDEMIQAASDVLLFYDAEYDNEEEMLKELLKKAIEASISHESL